MATGLLNGKSVRGRYRPLSEINVTPLVDVMLVLLIIFMVTAPLMTSGVSVDLPKTDAKPLNTDSEPLTVSINSEGKIFLQSEEIQLPELVAKLQALSQNDNGRRIFVRGDKDISYGLAQPPATPAAPSPTPAAAQPTQATPATTPATPPTPAPASQSTPRPQAKAD
jgi:biopolymer transport protein TolR